MAILDKTLEFADGITAAGFGTTITLLGDVVDLTAARDIGQGRPMFLVLLVDTAFDGGGGSGGLSQFALVSDAQAAIAVDGAESIHWKSDILTAGQLTAGTRFVIPLPMGDTGPGTGYERFLGVQINPTVEEEDAAVVTAYLTFDPQGWVSTPDASN